MCGCRRSKPSNLERFSEDARSPWRLDDKRGRHSDAIHCHLSVYHQFLFNPLHGSLGRAPRSSPALCHPLWSPGGSGRLCLC